MFTVYTLTMYFITIPGNRQAGASNFAEFFRTGRRRASRGGTKQDKKAAPGWGRRSTVWRPISAIRLNDKYRRGSTFMYIKNIAGLNSFVAGRKGTGKVKAADNIVLRTRGEDVDETSSILLI